MPCLQNQLEIRIGLALPNSRRSLLRLLTVLPLVVLGQVVPAAACPMTLPPVRDLALERYYSDEAGAEVDLAKKQAHEAATAPVRSYLTGLVKEADASFRATTPSLGVYRARCALEHLQVWALGNALLGRIEGKQSEAELRWTLAGLALAYLKVKPHAAPEQRVDIESWLVRLADSARQAFEASGAKHNNHWYWLGLGLGATAVAADSPRHWEVARAIMQDAARDIRADGALPLELARGQRALHYHAFALMPLVTLAELARIRGEDWESLGDQALARLVDLTTRGLQDPRLFDALAGVEQERPAKPGSGWLPLYVSRHPAWVPPVDVEMPSGHRWLGGNVLLLGRVTTAVER